MATSAQRHPTVPSSDAPPIPEWAPHYWYVLRATALQAHSGISDADGENLVRFFTSLATALPCSECRGHYADDWKTHPFTLAQARDTNAAVAWLEALRARVDARVAAKKAAEANKPAPVTVPANRHSHVFAPAPARPRGLVTQRPPPSQRTAVSRSPVKVPSVQRLAVQAAVQNTVIRKTGGPGCRSCRRRG